MTVETGEFPPLAKFSARFGIIEKIDPVLPVTVRNLEAQIAGAKLKLGGDAESSLLTRIEATLWRVPQPKAGDVLSWLNRVAEAKRADVGVQRRECGRRAAVRDAEAQRPQCIRGDGHSAQAPRVVHRRTEEHSARALFCSARPSRCTFRLRRWSPNLAVHFKQGQANSLVWVTALESGRPVGGADVAVADCHGSELWTGRTDARGLAMVPTSAAFANLPQCDSSQTDHESDYFSNQVEALSGLNRGLLVTAQRGRGLQLRAFELAAGNRGMALSSAD